MMKAFPAILLIPLLAGCVSHNATDPKPLTPTTSELIASASETFEATATAVEIWLDLANVKPARAAEIRAAIGAGRAAIESIRADVADGKPLDAIAVLRSIRAATQQLRVMREDTVKADAAARMPKATR